MAKEKDYGWIESTQMDFQALFERMDKDADMYNQIEYKLKDLNNQLNAKDVVNITMNDPKVFADRAQAFMNSAAMQTVVDGRSLTDKEKTKVEHFDEDIRYEIDCKLNTRDIAGLYPFTIEQSCIRGTIGARYTSWDNNGIFVPDLVPCDSRFLIYEYGDEELERVGFKTFRSKEAIIGRYPSATFRGDANKGAIWEEWTKDWCRIWLTDPYALVGEGQQLDEKPNVYGYVPFIVQGVGAGTMLQDDNSRQHRFESIFANNRLLYGHLNMLGSILQTLNYMTFNRAYQWESEAGAVAKSPPKQGTRKTIPIDKGTRGLFPTDIEDIGQATRLFYALLLGAIQRGSLPNIDYGNLTFPLSAVAISKLTSQKDAIFSPRLQAIALFLRKLHYMIRDQYVMGKYEATLGERGLTNNYKASDLNKDYAVYYKFHSVSPEQDIANYAVAQQALAVGMSPETVFTDIIKLQDPIGEINKGRAYRAEQLDPVVAMFRYAHALVDEGTDESFLEADLVVQKIEDMVKNPQPIQEPTQRGVQGKGLVNLLDGGGAPPQAEEDEGWISEPENMLRREERRREVVRKSEVES